MADAIPFQNSVALRLLPLINNVLSASSGIGSSEASATQLIFNNAQMALFLAIMRTSASPSASRTVLKQGPIIPAPVAKVDTVSSMADV